MANFGNEAEAAPTSRFADSEDPELVVAAKALAPEVGEFTYSEKEICLYNLGLGATEKELKYVFEGDDEFQAIPTFGVIPQFSVAGGVSRESTLLLCYARDDD